MQPLISSRKVLLSQVFALTFSGDSVGGLAMRTLSGLAGAALFLASTSVNAANLCNCCDMGAAESCTAVCASVKPGAGQCVAMVDYAGEATIAAGENPLYGISLRNISLEDAMGPQLEEFRKLLEATRRGVEQDRKVSNRDFAKHKIDEATVLANTKRYEDAIVNYYLGWRAYRDRVATAP
jgi:hypothetical protein